MSELVEILDISRYQDARGPIDWQRVAAAGIAAVYVKATEGTTYVNPSLAGDVAGARGAGFEVGAYHFLRGGDGSAQADHFLATVAGLDLTLPAAVDVEVGHSEMADIAVACAERLEEGGAQVIVYTYENFQVALAGRPELGARLLWLARYSAHAPTPAGPWAGQPLGWWQYTGSGACDGVVGPVDRSRGALPADRPGS